MERKAQCRANMKNVQMILFLHVCDKIEKFLKTHTLERKQCVGIKFFVLWFLSLWCIALYI